MTQTSKPQARPTWTSPALVLLLVAFACLATVYSVVNPLFEAPDETYHTQMVKRLADGGGLPVQDPAHPGPWLQEGSQPPLYYWLAALATRWLPWDGLSELQRINGYVDVTPARPTGYSNMVLHTGAEAWPYRGAVLAVHLARGLSVLLGALTVLFTYLIGLELQPRRPGPALAAAALAAFTPMFLYVSASVNNDNLVITLSSVALWLMLRLLRLPPTPARWALLGAVIGLAALTKISALGLLPLAALALAWAAWQRRDWSLFLWGGTCVVGAVALVAGWWYYRNWRLYGDPLGWSAFLAMIGTRAHPLTARGLVGEWPGFVRSYWGVFGWSNVMAPARFYHLCDALTVLGAGGLVMQLAQRRLAAQPLVPAAVLRLALVSLWPLVAVAGVVRYTLLTQANQGRLVFPAIAPLSYLLALGWAGYLKRKTKDIKPGLAIAPDLTQHTTRNTPYVSRFTFYVSRIIPIALLAGLAIWLPFGVIAPAYARPPLLTPAQLAAIPNRLELTVGDEMELLGYRLDQAEVTPGQDLRLTLYWQARVPARRDYSAFVHLLDQNEIKIAQQDALIGRGLFPTTLWQAGDAIADTYVVQVPADTFRPNRLQLLVGLHPLASAKPLAVRDAQGRDLGTSVQLAQVAVPAVPQGSLPNPTGFDLERQATLAGYDLDRTALRPGEALRLTLFWQPRTSLAGAYTAFAHILAPDGSLWAGSTQPAADWPQGQVTPATYDLTLRPDTPAGEYYVDAGLYHTTSGRPLSLLDRWGHALDQRAVLTRIRVLPPEPVEPVPQFDLPPVQHPLDVTFPGVARLRGYSLGAEALNRHEPLQVTLYWQALADAPVPVDYKVFVHLLDGQGQMLAQHDSPPALGAWPTTRWRKGQLVVDRHDLSFSEGSGGGPARLEVGLYDPVSLQRLTASTGDDKAVLPAELQVAPSF